MYYNGSHRTLTPDDPWLNIQNLNTDSNEKISSSLILLSHTDCEVVHASSQCSVWSLTYWPQGRVLLKVVNFAVDVDVNVDFTSECTCA